MDDIRANFTERLADLEARLVRIKSRRHALLPADSEDPAQALAWYEKAAEAGSGRAAATLGVMFALGDSVEADDDKARQYFALAGDLGYPWDDLAAQCGLDPDAYC